MEIYTVWKGDESTHTGTYVGEKCLIRDDGNFIGIETGNVYDEKLHYCSKKMIGKIVSADSVNKTGMYHLNKDTDGDEENREKWKKFFVGCFVTLEKAHLCGDLSVYRCLELKEYFSSNEIKIVKYLY